jgi:hypothetical protein
MIVVARTAELVERGEALLHALVHVREEEVLVDRTVRAALRARTVVADHHDQRVVELTGRRQDVEQAAERRLMLVGLRTSMVTARAAPSAPPVSWKVA